MNEFLGKLGFVLSVWAAVPSGGAVTVGSPFGDHMVLQRGCPVPVWGTAGAGEPVAVAFHGQIVRTVAGDDGRWRVELPAMVASSEGARLVVSGGASPSPVVLEDVLVGEVWLCGGQSNMERQLGTRPPQLPITNWKAEVAGAQYPLIRQLRVEQTRSLAPQETVVANWSVCSPEAAVDFTAVGYFFARDLYRNLRVPVGIINSSWGGTPSEAWTSGEALAGFPEIKADVDVLRRLGDDPDTAKRRYEDIMRQWYSDNDPGSRDGQWSRRDLDTAGWDELKVPGLWEDRGHPGFDGIAWLRTGFDLPDDWVGRDVVLRLGAVDDADTTWVNGECVGATDGWQQERIYNVPAGILKRGWNAVAVRVFDNWGGGGIWNPELPPQVALAGEPSRSIPLAGPWKARFGVSFAQTSRPPFDLFASPNAPTVLYNGMIAPLVPYAIRGFAFYQGEANAERARQYRTLFPALIADWRNRWGQGDLPFLFVQIAPFNGMPPEIREAQLLAWQETRNTAMVVTLDIGNAEDIHPADKAPVGARLCLAARALAYGESLEYSGPVYDRLRISGDRAIVSFRHLGGGLLAIGGDLSGFTVAGTDGRFVPAGAEILGDEVVVSSPEVTTPVAVRYGWANAPEGNLFNQAGLPASPFRSDSE